VTGAIIAAQIGRDSALPPTLNDDMTSPRVLILRAPGTNCDEEAAHAFVLAGGAAERWHVNRLLEEPRRLGDFQIVCVPGGFSYGDDIAAGRIFGNQIQHHLADTLQEFRASDKLILGICNGFQVLLKTNLLLQADDGGPTATLTLNDSGRFEARWVRLGVEPGNCVFLQGIRELELPVAHAEGKFVTRSAEIFTSFDTSKQFVLRYLPIGDSHNQRGVPKPKSQVIPYPANPNGAIGNVAGACDATGRVFGLMPHPERFVDATQHPRWTRDPARETGDGLRVFQNAVRYFL
jgi:phosphoribosylformylglycinamidine synthase subunit PurQ / glutaminase